MDVQELKRLASLEFNDEPISFAGGAGPEVSEPSGPERIAQDSEAGEQAEEEPIKEVLEVPLRKFHKKPKVRLLIAASLMAFVGGFATIAGNSMLGSIGEEAEKKEVTAKMEPEEKPFATEEANEQQLGDLKTDLALSKEENDLARINAAMAAKRKAKNKDGRSVPGRGTPTTLDRTVQASIPTRSAPSPRVTAYRVPQLPRRLPVVSRPAPRPIARSIPRPAPQPAPRSVAPAPVQPSPPKETQTPQVNLLAEQQLAFLDNTQSLPNREFETTLASQQQSFLQNVSTVTIPLGSNVQGEIMGQAIATINAPFDVRVTQGIEGIPTGSVVTAQVKAIAAEGHFQAQVTAVNGAPLQSGVIEVLTPKGDLILASGAKRKTPFFQTGVGQAFLGIGQKLGNQIIENALPGDSNALDGVDTVNLFGQQQPQQFSSSNQTQRSILIQRGPVSLHVQQPTTLSR